MQKINNKVKENINLMNTPLMSILPGQISFFVILSIIPLLSILFIIVSKLSINFNFISNFLVHYLPQGATDVIMLVLNEQKAGIFDSLFIITAFYLASKATHSIIVASTQIYNGQQKDFFRTRIKAIFMLLILMFLVFLLISIISIGGRLLRYLYSINPNLNPIISSIYTFIKWPFAFLMVFYVVKIIYTIAPNVSIPSKSVNKGALLTTIVWVIFILCN